VTATMWAFAAFTVFATVVCLVDEHLHHRRRKK
jgi:hypothetical protein